MKVDRWHYEALKRDAERWRRLATLSWHTATIVRRAVRRAALAGAVAGGWAALLHVTGVV